MRVYRRTVLFCFDRLNARMRYVVCEKTAPITQAKLENGFTRISLKHCRSSGFDSNVPTPQQADALLAPPPNYNNLLLAPQSNNWQLAATPSTGWTIDTNNRQLVRAFIIVFISPHSMYPLVGQATIVLVRQALPVRLLKTRY